MLFLWIESKEWLCEEWRVESWNLRQWSKGVTSTISSHTETYLTSHKKRQNMSYRIFSGTILCVSQGQYLLWQPRLRLSAYVSSTVCVFIRFRVFDRYSDLGFSLSLRVVYQERNKCVFELSKSDEEIRSHIRSLCGATSDLQGASEKGRAYMGAQVDP